MSLLLYVLGGLFGLFVLFVIIVFNKMVSLSNATKNTFSQIDVLIRKRTNVLLAISEIVKGETKHEKDVFTSIAKLRTESFSQDEISAADSDIARGEKVVKQVFAIKESYPSLKSNKSFLKYMAEMTNVENEIMRMRHVYNNVVETYNSYIQVFPVNLFSKIFGFKQREYFKE